MLIHVLEGCQKKCNSYLAQWALDGSSSRRRQVRWVRCRDFGGCWIVWWETPCSDLLCSISSTAAIRSSAAPYVEVMVPNWIRRGWLAPNGFHGFVELRRRLLFRGKREAPRCNSHSRVGFSSKTTENQNEFYPNEFVRSDSELISSWLGLDHLRSEWNQLQFESNFRRCSMTRAANQSWWLWTGFVRVDWFATDSWFLRSLFFSFFFVIRNRWQTKRRSPIAWTLRRPFVVFTVVIRMDTFAFGYHVAMATAVEEKLPSEGTRFEDVVRSFIFDRTKSFLVDVAFPGNVVVVDGGGLRGWGVWQ